MSYENFYYMIFTRHSAGKFGSSICIQDSAYYTLSDFLYQICLKGKSDENYCFYVQNTEAHSNVSHITMMELFANIDIA